LRKVIIVCHHFVPYTPAVGGVARVWYLADYLARHDFAVVVVASDGHDFGTLGFPELAPGVRVIYVPDRVKRIMQRQVSVLRTAAAPGNFRSKLLHGLRKVAEKFAFPDFAVFALPGYYRALKKEFRSGDVAALLVSAPAHSLMLLLPAFAGSKRNGTRLFADYRDGWNAGGIFAAKSWLRGALARRLEGLVCRKVDHALFATKAMQANTETLFPVLRAQDKSLTVMNGYPASALQEEADAAPVAASGRFSIGYFGVANDQPGSYRNIAPILAALAELKVRGVDFILEMYGDVRVAHTDLAAHDFVVLQGSVSHHEALARMRRMDCLLMYHMEREGAQEVVTGKFFDYVAARRPILCVSPREMEGARMVEAGGFGRVADFEDAEDIRAAFLDIFHGAFVLNTAKSTEYSREAQYSKLLPLLN
jgi:hypothetical protein